MILDKDRVKENIEKRINDDLASGRIGGAICLVKQNCETVYRNCFGCSADGKQLADDAIFRLASMTKPITGVAIMRQIEKGLASLDDTIDRFIPEYSEMELGRVSDGRVEIVGRAQSKIKILHQCLFPSSPILLRHIRAELALTFWRAWWSLPRICRTMNI